MYGKAYNTNEASIVAIIGQETLMSLALNCNIDIKGRYKAPYREDNTPGCKLSYYQGTLFFIDFASTPTHMTAIQLLTRVRGTTKQETLHYLTTQYNIKTQQQLIPPPPIQQKKTTINITPRQWQQHDQNYWIKYGITLQHLNDYKVIPIQTLTINNKTLPYEPYQYAYTDFENNRMKIYKPYNKQYKWLSNTIISDIGMIRELPVKGNLIIITKSFKDAMIIRNAQYDVIWTQSECIMPPKQVIFSITKRFTHIIILYDNDEVGMQKSKMLQQHIKNIDNNVSCSIIHIDMPYVKDIGEMTETYGLNATNKWIANNLI